MQLFTFLSLCTLTAHAAGGCSTPNGTFAVSGSCDAYIECKNGVAEEKLCPDGLLFNEKSTGYPCSYPIDVECTQPSGRLQSAQSTEDCPHQFGYYRMGDASHCGQFKNCASGTGYIFDCPEGLAYNKDNYRCDWPDQVEDCDVEAFLGFSCPAPALKSDLLGEQELEYDFHAHASNCQKYFICIEGRPRLVGCGEDQAFNPATSACDDIENVPTCSADIKQKGVEIKNARLAAAAAKPLSARTG